MNSIIKNSNRVMLIVLGIFMVFTFSFTFISCGNSNSNSNSNSTRSSNSVPFKVKMAVEQALDLNPSIGGEITELTGKKLQTTPTGVEIWKISIKFKVMANGQEQSVNWPEFAVE